MKDILQFELLSLGNYSLQVHNIVNLLLLLVAIFILLRILRKIINHSKLLDTGKKFTFYQLTKYVVVIIGLLLGIKALGFDVTLILAGSAALLVGMGFGLQNIFSDFLSGIIILLDQTVKVGDIIEVNGEIYRVQEVNFRTTNVIGRDENYAILPNSELTRNTIIHWTHYKISSRFSITVGVDYSTDPDKLIAILTEIARKEEAVLNTPAPFVRLEDYADFALIFSLYFFTNEVFRVENIKSKLRIEILKALRAQGITIPFPQHVIHRPKESKQL